MASKSSIWLTRETTHPAQIGKANLHARLVLYFATGAHVHDIIEAVNTAWSHEHKFSCRALATSEHEIQRGTSTMTESLTWSDFEAVGSRDLFMLEAQPAIRKLSCTRALSVSERYANTLKHVSGKNADVQENTLSFPIRG